MSLKNLILQYILKSLLKIIIPFTCQWKLNDHYERLCSLWVTIEINGLGELYSLEKTFTLRKFQMTGFC